MEKGYNMPFLTTCLSWGHVNSLEGQDQLTEREAEAEAIKDKSL